ncbi:RagB/SusD family nutrient uptake outer membrane protein [Aquimarina sp. I32.4]|uniref:RagB/SusD family nutrient uptake outer membrane protein n=1 Tax=Aquimarina sp. I32.4 TaxID=2053903 RepID=UPI000CDEDB4F|nr:RagB/SusD family nutrient uptake outer membrane protein [Aquimarina sp. I32.4]
MKYLNKIYIKLIFGLFFLVLQGCDLDVENLNEPGRNSILGSTEGVIALLHSTNSAFFKNLVSSKSNVDYDYLADQLVSCNPVEAWPMNREPRERIYNDVGGTFEGAFIYDWEAAYRAISTANKILKKIDTWTLENNEVKNKVKASALILKGLATGYVGLIYKKGIILDYNIPAEKMTFSNYKDVINKAVEYLNEAKNIYTNNPELNWDYLPGFNLSSIEIKKVLNTYAAKFLLGKARNHEDFKSLDFNLIQSYLDNAIENDFTGPGSREIYNSYQSFASRERWSKVLVGVDQKIPWLLSNKTAPTKKRVTDSPPITSIDARTNLYFEYKEVINFYYSEYDPTLYSNYKNVKYTSFLGDLYDFPANILHIEEIVLLKAEVAYGLGNYTLAESILNNSNRVTVGQMPLLTGANKTDIADALFYENSIELHLAGKAINWMFMRRWNLLQEGTMLHYPVPALEAQLLNAPIITIGGQGTGDGIDSAKGDTSWR